ncbi:MAG: PQQ-dependent sugar dehydrogenase, partial [Panacibacter sp.]
MKKVTTSRIVSPVKGFALLFFLMNFFIVYGIEAQPQLVYSPLIGNLSFPVAITSANDGSNRLFIVEQGGLIKIYKNGAVLSKPFIDLTNIVQASDLKGLWSIAFAPNFAVSRTFFVYYIDNNGATTLARFKVSNANPDSAILNSGVVLFSLPGGATGGPKFGDLHFGNEGYLYLTVSDGSSPSRTTKFAQDGKTLFGKMLRLNVNVTDAPYYSVPPDNPYANNPNMRGEI